MPQTLSDWRISRNHDQYPGTRAAGRYKKTKGVDRAKVQDRATFENPHQSLRVSTACW
ncbi:MAG: hypothetical protein JWN34_4033 [Bryobacterales bacterium]|nr:hypothetical protein [Bryobacterales bacterium]